MRRIIPILSGSEYPQDVFKVAAAILLALSPWLFGFSGDRVALATAGIGAFVIIAVAFTAFVRFAEWEEWLEFALGVVVIVAPWPLGFASVGYAADAFAFVGGVVCIASLSEIFVIHEHATAK